MLWGYYGINEGTGWATCLTGKKKNNNTFDTVCGSDQKSWPPRCSSEAKMVGYGPDKRSPEECLSFSSYGQWPLWFLGAQIHHWNTTNTLRAPSQLLKRWAVVFHLTAWTQCCPQTESCSEGWLQLKKYGTQNSQGCLSQSYGPFLSTQNSVHKPKPGQLLEGGMTGVSTPSQETNSGGVMNSSLQGGCQPVASVASQYIIPTTKQKFEDPSNNSLK